MLRKYVLFVSNICVIRNENHIQIIALKQKTQTVYYIVFISFLDVLVELNLYFKSS